jgi:type II secretory pathway pseudopilin PulG
MTLIELVIALTIFGVIITVTLAFVSSQNTAFQTAVQRLGTLRNVRYAVTTLAQDVETLGTNVPLSQPALIYGDSSVIVFSADYVTNVDDDPFAVFYDPDAPSGQVSAPSSAFTIPTTALTASDSTYRVQGVLSPAEIIVFYFEADASTSRSDDHILFRQVNDAAPEELARNLLRVDGLPFFSYLREIDGSGELQVVADSLLPLYHQAPLHLALADTGQASWPDSIRAVQVTIGGTNGLGGDRERQVETERLIPLPNAGQEVLSTCGSVPLLGVGLGVAADTLGSGEPVIELTWNPATDESGGEEDVVRYVIWRKESGQPDWGDAYLAIPAGDSSYTYVDAAVESGKVYQFALAAQDCTPSLSTLTASSLVAVP